MTDLPVTNHDLKQAQSYLLNPSQPLLILCPQNGLSRSLAEYMMETVLPPSSSLESYPYKLIISPETTDTKGIGIDEVRSVIKFLSLKVPVERSINRLLAILEADTMTEAAQNALLKSIEEPPASTLVILTASSDKNLLPTLRSRMKELKISNPDKNMLLNMDAFKTMPPADFDRLFSLSGGDYLLMQNILSNPEHQANQALSEARKILISDSYERLLMVDVLSKNKSLATDVCEILQTMAEKALAGGSGNQKTWLKVLESSNHAKSDLERSVQPKLALTALMLAL